MFIPENDQEALLLLSAIGFSMGDWPSLQKLGAPRDLIQSSLFEPALAKINTQDLRAKLDDFYAEGAYLVTPCEYPNRLFKSKRAPLIFFGRFNQKILHTSAAVSLVGSREACEKGLQWAGRLAASLARQKITVVSGGAMGIDMAAHVGALKAGGNTVLISGLSCSLKADSLCQRIAQADRENIAVLYPFGPFEGQKKYMFVERNRFVAGFSDALVIVQGLDGSGTLHTARFAQELKIPIFVLPGAIDNPLSYVPNKLLEQGHAKALSDLELDFLALLGHKAPELSKVKVLKKINLADEPPLLRLIRERGKSMSMGDILGATGKPFLEMQRELLSYELSGRIVKRGAQFVLTDD